MRLPNPRGSISSLIVAALRGQNAQALRRAARALDDLPIPADVVRDEDIQLALWTMYELSYQGFEGVDERWEWDTDLLALRGRLEDAFEAQLREETQGAVLSAVAAKGDVAERLFGFIDGYEGPPLAGFLQRRATGAQMLEFLVHRSIYNLKESDPHSFVLPRLHGAAKVALAELQYDEYGAGRPARLHSTLFAQSLQACGLDPGYGAYIDLVSASTLAVNNSMSMFALHRRLRAADMGHIAAFEATSSLPCRRIAGGLRRLGFSETAAEYFDEHVEADAVHEQLAIRGICAVLVAEDERLLDDVFFGAAVCLELEARSGTDMLQRWERHLSSLEGQENLEVAGA